MARLKKLAIQWLVFLLVAVFLVWIISRIINWGQCSWYGYQTERETRFAPFVGCMVKVKDAWYPRNELRVTQ